ncbi:MAG: leucine-rich repeat protein, partial [Clostridia bacterium]|nr:leucine-rich repeat protein [Clostridia bacterium]
MRIVKPLVMLTVLLLAIGLMLVACNTQRDPKDTTIEEIPKTTEPATVEHDETKLPDDEVTTAGDVTYEPATEEPTASESVTNEPTTDEVTTDEPATGAPHEHAWGDWTEDKVATCTEKGSEKRTCDCGESESREVAAWGHTEVIAPAVEATCTETGLTEGTHCTTCDAVLVAQEIVAAKGHTEVIDPAVAATCTETGLTEGKHCEVCEIVLVAQKIMPIMHNYVNGKCELCGMSKPSEGLAFVSNGNGTCYVSGIGTCKDTNVVIPAVSPKGECVTGIDYEAFFGRSSLTSIEIPDSVIYISVGAFRNCTSLESIMIPRSVTSIGYKAFYNCSSLTSIEIPESVASIGSMAFYGCNNVIEIENGVSYVDKWVVDCDTEVIDVTLRLNTVGIGNEAFEDCTRLTSIEIPDGVTSIGIYAFSGC